MIVEEHLIGSEQIAYKAHIHAIKYAPAIFATIISLICFSYSAKWHLRLPLLKYAGGIALAIAAWYAITAYIRIHSSDFAVTNRRVIVQFGYLRRRSIEIFLGKVEGISINQSLLGRIFNFGDINIRGGGIEEDFRTVAAPYQFRRQVESLADAIVNR
jgi:uncharacterized membrane protein YdbT with pleckstrin-like domain